MWSWRSSSGCTQRRRGLRAWKRLRESVGTPSIYCARKWDLTSRAFLMPPIWRLGQGYVRATSRVQASERRGRTRRANAYVKTALVQAAHTTARTQTYLGEPYRRLRKRRGAKRAAVAVGHSNMAHLVSHDDHRRAVSRERCGVLSQPEPGPSRKTALLAAQASGLSGHRSSCCLR